jgi:HPt (histidine-containing phosphotransfer) domain-containing protein
MRTQEIFMVTKTDAGTVAQENSIKNKIAQEIDAVRNKFAASGMDDVLDEMLALFLDEKRQIFRHLQDSVRIRDSRTLAAAAHRLKGTFLSLELASLTGLVLQIESQALSPKPDWILISHLLEEVEYATELFPKRPELNKPDHKGIA